MAKSNYESVKEFHKAFSYSMPSKPTPMTKEMVLNRTSFDAEETIELLHATCKSEEELRELYANLITRMNTTLEKQLLKTFPKNEDEKLVAQIDACIDKRYFNSGDFTLLGVNPDPLFEIVHSANMLKLFPDGKPRYNDQGKVIKPDGWVAPEPLLKQEIKRQMKEC